MNEDAARLVRDLGLAAHPEGGYYRETYRSDPTGGRGALSSIVFLLPHGKVSAFHRIDGDEAWHHYAGDDLAIHVVLSDGGYDRHVIGRAGPWQAVVPRGNWFAAEVLEGSAGYALVGCDVGPAFSFDGFELAGRDALLAEHPEHAALVVRFTAPHAKTNGAGRGNRAKP